MSDVTQPCPSCAAPIPVDARWTRMAVCPTCRSSVTFDDGVGELAGELSVLPPSRTALFVGAQGAAQGRPFEVLGRVRYGWERGYWDEWHLLWTDDGTTGWLSEDEERLVVESLIPGAQVPVAAGAAPGTAVEVGGDAFTVTERGVGLVEGGEGQLPFKIVAGEATPFVEMRSEDGAQIASAEFGLDGERLFVGAPVSLGDLDMAWTRQELGIQGDLPLAAAADGSVPRIQSLSGGVRPLKCTSCGGGLEVASGEGGQLPAAVACAYCGAANSLSGKALACPNCMSPIQTLAGDAKVAHCGVCDHQADLTGGGPSNLGAAGPAYGAWFKPGDRWAFEGLEYTVTGMIRLDGYSDGEAWNYWEYCLFEKTVGYRWLVHSDGQWTLATRVFDHPPLSPDFTPTAIEYRDTTYRVTEDNRVKISYVLGELPWVARKGDTVRVVDTATQGGQAVSVEWGPDEVEWYLGKKVHVRRPSTAGGPSTGGERTHGRWVRHVLWMLFATLLAGGGLAYYVEEEARPTRVATGALDPEKLSRESQSFAFKFEKEPVTISFNTTGSSASNSLKGAWVHYTVEVVGSDNKVADRFTLTHTDFYLNGNGAFTYNKHDRVKLDIPPGAYVVKVAATTGVVDGSRTAAVKPILQYRVMEGYRYRVDTFLAGLAVVFVVFLFLGMWALTLSGSKRADSPALPMATVVWAVVLWGGLGWALSETHKSAGGEAPKVAAVPTYRTVAAYATLRAAARAASVRYSSSGSSSSYGGSSGRSYSGGGYRSGK